MQWMSFFLVVCFGGITLITNDPRFVMIKPSLIYMVVGAVMLKPGWMNCYLPPVAIEVVADVARIFGFIWSGLMFFSAGLNVIVALKFSVVITGAIRTANTPLRASAAARTIMCGNIIMSDNGEDPAPRG